MPTLSSLPEITLRIRIDSNEFDLPLGIDGNDLSVVIGAETDAWSRLPWAAIAPDPSTESLTRLVLTPGELLGQPSATGTLLSGSDNSTNHIANLVLSPPTARNSAWQHEYTRRVLLRAVAQAAIRRYLLGRPGVWPKADRTTLVSSTWLGEKKLPKAHEVLALDVSSYYSEHSAVPALLSSHPDLKVERVPERTCDHDLVDDLINGMIPAAVFDGAPRIEYDWSAFPRTGSSATFIPSVRVTLTDDSTTLTSIEVSINRGGDVGPAALWTLYRPSDGARWEYAKHCARVANLVAGQVWGHLGRGHVVTQIYRRAVDAIPANAMGPLVRLLSPFLRMVDEINTLGDPLIFGEGGILSTTSALGVEGVRGAVARAVQDERWERWSEPHLNIGLGRYGEAAALYSERLHHFVTMWLGEHGTGVEGSAEALALRNALHAERAAWGARPAPVTSTRADIVKMCCHAIFFATFFHTWSNDRQWEMGSNPHITSFGLARGSQPADDEDYTDWRRRAIPSAGDAWFQILLADTLTHSPFGRMGALPEIEGEPFTDEDFGIFEALRSTLEPRAAEFDALQFPLSHLRACVGI